MDRLKLLDAGLRAFDARMPDATPSLCLARGIGAAPAARVSMSVRPGRSDVPVARAGHREVQLVRSVRLGLRTGRSAWSFSTTPCGTSAGLD